MMYFNFQLDFNSAFELLHALMFRQSYLSAKLKTVDSSKFPGLSKSLNRINSLLSDFEKVISTVENMEDV